MRRYRYQVQNFVQKFKTELKPYEIEIWKNKSKKTEADTKVKTKPYDER